MPRLLIASVSGGSGKTIVSMGLLMLLRRAGIQVRAFKKGPDYIDPAWLAWAAASPACNLDTFLMGAERVRASFLQHGIDDGINLIEGNRGLFDGLTPTARTPALSWPKPSQHRCCFSSTQPR